MSCTCATRMQKMYTERVLSGGLDDACEEEGSVRVDSMLGRWMHKEMDLRIGMIRGHNDDC